MAEKYDNEEYKSKGINKPHIHFREPKKRLGPLSKRLNKGSTIESQKYIMMIIKYLRHLIL
jgi:hypothetical protein